MTYFRVYARFAPEHNFSQYILATHCKRLYFFGRILLCSCCGPCDDLRSRFPVYGKILWHAREHLCSLQHNELNILGIRDF